MQGTTSDFSVGDGRYIEIDLEVTAQDSVTKKTYTVKVSRLPSPVSTLEALTVVSASGRATYRVCAAEGASCTCRGSVIYGRVSAQTDGTGTAYTLSQLMGFDYKEMESSSSTLCNAATMGGDPVPGYTKHCVCMEQQATDASPQLTQAIRRYLRYFSGI